MGRSIRRGSAGSGSADRSAARAQDANAEVSRATMERNSYKLPFPIRDLKEDGEQLGWQFEGNAATATDAENIGGVPAEDIIPDGLPPSSSPACSLYGGIGFLIAKWDAITNHDPVTYDIHLSTTTGFTPSGGTYHGSTGGTSYAIRTTVAGAALANATPYYVKIIARDVDGSAAAGSQGSATLTLVTGPDIAANAIVANHILAGEITADKLEAVLTISNLFQTAGSGQRVEIDTDGIRLIDSADNLLVDLPTDDSETPTFYGALKAAGVELSAGDADFFGSDTPFQWVGAGGVLRAELTGGGDSGESNASLAARHDTEAHAVLRASEVDGDLPIEISVSRQPGASAGNKERIDLFGASHVGAIKLIDDTGDSDFLRRYIHDAGTVAASTNSDQFIQLGEHTAWLLNAWMSGPNQETMRSYIIHVGPPALNVNALQIGAGSNFSLGNISIVTQNGAGGWTFNGASAGQFWIRFTAGSGGTAAWSYDLYRMS